MTVFRRSDFRACQVSKSRRVGGEKQFWRNERTIELSGDAFSGSYTQYYCVANGE